MKSLSSLQFVGAYTGIWIVDTMPAPNVSPLARFTPDNAINLNMPWEFRTHARKTFDLSKKPASGQLLLTERCTGSSPG
jgi:hypothetical protein